MEEAVKDPPASSPTTAIDPAKAQPAQIIQNPEDEQMDHKNWYRQVADIGLIVPSENITPLSF